MRNDIRYAKAAVLFFRQIAPGAAFQFRGYFVDRTANSAKPQPGSAILT
ncbi:MAG: hypothetical protein JSS06_02805 [Proteobacteria bacterium]|nr:hypothetical protein [Pseudomonadota bacterium]